MNRIFIKNFRIKLAFFLIIAAFIPVAALETISIYDAIRYEKHVIENFEEVDLESQLHIFDYWLSKKMMEMQSMTDLFKEEVTSNHSNNNIASTLDLLLLQDSDIINTYYTDETGLNLVSNGQQGIVDGRNRKWYKTAISEGIAVSSPYLDALTGKQVITFSSVIKDGETIVGVLGVDILFSQVIEKFFFPFNDSGTELITLNSLGEVIYASSNYSTDAVEKYINFENDFTDIFESEYVLQKNIESLDINIIIVFSRAKFFEKHFDRNFRYFSSNVLIIATLVLIIIVAFIVSKLLSKPIHELENKAKMIVEGKEVSNAYSGFEDLDELLKLFEEFQYTIKQNEKSIINMRSELDERNRTLTSLNEEYEKAYSELERFSVELAEKEGEYENLVGNIVDLIWNIDADGVLTYGNNKLLELLGYEDHEFVGMELSEIVPSFKMAYSDNPYGLLHSRDYDAIDIEFVNKENEHAILTSTSTTRIFQNNRLVSIQGVSRDVTLEKRMFNELNSRNRDLMLINKIGKEMTMTDNLKSVLDLILDNVDSLFEMKVASIRFLDADGRLKVRAHKGNISELLWPKESIEVLESHIGYAIEHKHPIVLNSIEDIILEMDYPIIDKLVAGYKVVILPLSNSDSTFGALSIMSIDIIDQRILSVLSAFANSTSVALERAILFETLQKNYFKTIEALVTAMEAKNHLMQGHSNRVSLIAEYIGEKLYLSKDELRDLYIAGLLHDVGKIGLRDVLLRKDFQGYDSRLKEEITAAHIEIGKKILTPVGLTDRVLNGVYYHHKHFDQTGYPEVKLKEVPLFALIIGVADDIDILMKRNTNNPLTIDEMREFLINGAGKKYSPEIVNLVVELIDKGDVKLLEIINNEV